MLNYGKHFENYLQLNKEYDLHPELFENHIHENKHIKNTIFYGPSGVGKYTQVLKKIKSYSSTELKYEKKMSVTYNKQTYIFKMSDIHYEIDMSLLGCNAKILWHEIYHQIIDILNSKSVKIGIIVCKNFQDIHIELLENFYNYITNINNQNIHIYYYILTDQISFIPSNIINNFQFIRVSRPNKNDYKKCIQKNIQYSEKNNLCSENTIKNDDHACFDLKKMDKIQLENIQNIKQLYMFVQSDTENKCQHKIICNKIIQMIEIPYQVFPFLKFRDLLYELLIYHLNIYECVWYVMTYFIEKDTIPEKEINQLLIKTYVFFQYFNNNYRPIYHLENYFLSITKIVNEL